MDIRQTNLTSLRIEYFDLTGARHAANILEQFGADIGWRLRHHSRYPVQLEREIQLRDDFDDLLSFYSLIEISSLLQLIPRLPDELNARWLLDLDHPDLRAYYEEHYPLRLPS